MPLQKLPVRSLDTEERRRLVAERINGILDHQFDDSKNRTTSEVAAGLYPVNPAYTTGPVYQIERQGGITGTGNGATNDQAIARVLQIFAATGNKGGVIQFDRGDYYFDSTITLTFLWGITLRGAGGVSGGATPGTRLIYTGTGTRFIDRRGALGVHLQDLHIEFSNASFTGTLDDCGNDGTHDSFRCSSTRCNYGSSIGTGCLHIDLLQAIEFVADQCHFFYGNPSIEGTDAGDYSNVITFRDCTWTNSRAIPIARPGEAWAFYGCTFEALLSGAAGAIDCGSTSTPAIGLTLDSCWLGDVTASGGEWIYFTGDGLNIRGCRINGGGQSSTFALALESAEGVVIEGNQINDHTAVISFNDANNRAVSFKYNQLSNNTNTFSTSSNAPPDALFDFTPNYPQNNAEPTAAAWTTYSVTWTAATSNPSLGNGTLAGYYTKHSRVVTVALTLTAGSTTTFGTGAWFFTLPFVPAATLYCPGVAYVLDSGTIFRTGICRPTIDGTARVQVLIDSDTAFVDSGRPMAWATSDELHLSVTYLT